MRAIGLWALGSMCLAAAATPLAAGPINTTGQRNVHDPSRIMKVDGTYYVYYTGNSSTRRIRSRTSTNLVNWSNGPDIITSAPLWASSHVPTASNYWAPDVVFVDGEYHLYYSVSTFGSQQSGIGLMTNPTLNPAAPNYQWTDRGAVVTSVPDSNQSSPGYYNAIDPGIFLDEGADRMWMVFGSFWNGIRITELDPATGLRLSPTATMPLIARNESSDQIEAAYLHQHGGQYYLFVNHGTCCQGVNSTYSIRVGRSSSPTGPFLDKNGVNMTSNGGSLFLGADPTTGPDAGPVAGPGHFSIFEENGQEIFTYHYYDRSDNGASKLNWRTLEWAPNGWPVIGDTLQSTDFNADGNIGPLDLARWGADFGTAGSDANGDGVTDGDDFLLWQRALGGTPAMVDSSMAPEPTTPVLLAIGAILAASHIRRTRL